jgi:hypothetical protein
MAASAPMFIVKCPCGWTDTFSRGYSGLVIECATCGRNHRIPTVDSRGADDLDPAEVQRIMARMEPSRVSVNLRPMFIASAVVCVIAAIAAVIFFHDKFYPMGVVVVGGALSWPLGLWVAWLGQRRQLKKAQPPDAK